MDARHENTLNKKVQAVSSLLQAGLTKCFVTFYYFTEPVDFICKLFFSIVIVYMVYIYMYKWFHKWQI